MKIKKNDAVKMYADSKYGIYILNGTLMFKMDRETGETWVYAKREWHPIQTSVVSIDNLENEK